MNHTDNYEIKNTCNPRHIYEINHPEIPGHIAYLDYDPAPPDPRTEYEPVWTLACLKHKRYTLGDQQYDTWTEINEASKNKICVPLTLYDHSGLTLRAGYGRPDWDSGHIGTAYVSRARLIREFGRKPERFDRGHSLLKGELEQYNQYLNGDVWTITVLKQCTHCNQHSEIISACGGYYGLDWAEAQAKENLRGLPG